MRIRSVLALYIILFSTIQNTISLPIRINRGYVISGITLATSFVLFLSKTPITIQDVNFEQEICTEIDVTTNTLLGMISIGTICFVFGNMRLKEHWDRVQQIIDDRNKLTTNIPA